MPRPRKSEAERYAELLAHARALEAAIAACSPDNVESMAKVAESAGQIQRRARLLAGLGRGG